MSHLIAIPEKSVDLAAFRVFSERGNEDLSACVDGGEVYAVDYQRYGSRSDDYKRDNLAARQTFIQSLAAWGAKTYGGPSGSFDLDRLPKSVLNVLNLKDFGLVDGKVTSMKPLSKRRVKLLMDAVDRADGKVAVKKMDVSRLGREICDFIFRIADNNGQVPDLDSFEIFAHIPTGDNERRLHSDALARICKRMGDRTANEIFSSLSNAAKKARTYGGGETLRSLRLMELATKVKTAFCVGKREAEKESVNVLRLLMKSPEDFAKVVDSAPGRKLLRDHMSRIVNDFKVAKQGAKAKMKSDLATRTVMRMALKALAERTDEDSVKEFREFVMTNFADLKAYDIMLVRESLGARLKKAAPGKFTDEVLKSCKVDSLLELVKGSDEALRDLDVATLPEGGDSKGKDFDAETVELMQSVETSSQEVSVDGLAEISKKGELNSAQANKLLCGFFGLVGKLLHRDDGWANDSLGPAEAFRAVLKDNWELIAALKAHAEDMEWMLLRASYGMGALWAFGGKEEVKEDDESDKQFTTYLKTVFDNLCKLKLDNDGASSGMDTGTYQSINDAVNALAEDALKRVQGVITKIVVEQLLSGEGAQDNQSNNQTNLLAIVKARHPAPPNETAAKRLEREERMLAEYVKLAYNPKFGGLGALLVAMTKNYVGKQDARDKRSLLGGFFEALSSSSEQITGLLGELLPDLALNKRASSDVTGKLEGLTFDKVSKDKNFQALAGNVAGGVLKGAGPFLQKIVQMFGAGYYVPPYLKKAVEDCRNHLKSIPPSYVDARLNEIVIQSNGKIRKLERMESLGAASIAEAFKCRLTDDRGDSRTVVVKLMRPDVRARMEREIAVLNAVAETGDGDMKKMLEGHIKTLKSELSFKEEAQNIGECFELYGKTDDACLSSVRLVEGCPQSHDAIVMELAPGRTLQAYMEDMKGELGQVLAKCHIAKDENGKPLFTRLSGDDYDDARRTFEKFYYGVRKRHDNLQKFFKRWVENALFGDGKFHGDLHGGNVMIDDHALMTLIDFGNVGRFDSTARECVVWMMTAAVQGDADSFFNAILPILSDATRNKITTNPNLSNDIKDVIRKTFALGDSSSALQRLAVAVGEIARLGVEIPPSLFNFGMAAMRIYTLLMEMEKTLNSVRSASCYIQNGKFLSEVRINDINNDVKTLRGKDPYLSDADVIAKAKEKIKTEGITTYLEDHFLHGNKSRSSAYWVTSRYVELLGKFMLVEKEKGALFTVNEQGQRFYSPAAMDFIREHPLLDPSDLLGLGPLKKKVKSYEDKDTVDAVFKGFFEALLKDAKDYVEKTFERGILVPYSEDDKKSLPYKIYERVSLLCHWLERYRQKDIKNAEGDLTAISRFREWEWLAGAVHGLLKEKGVKQFNALMARFEDKKLEDFEGSLFKEQIPKTQDVLKGMVKGMVKKNVFSIAKDLGIKKGFGMGPLLDFGMDYLKKAQWNKPKKIRTGLGNKIAMSDFRRFSVMDDGVRVGVDDRKIDGEVTPELNFSKPNKSPDAESVHNAEARRAFVESLSEEAGYTSIEMFYGSSIWQNIAPILDCKDGQTMNDIEKAKPLTPGIVQEVLAVYDLTKVGCPVQVENALKGALGITNGGLAKGIGGIDADGFPDKFKGAYETLFGTQVVDPTGLFHDRATMTKVIMLAAEIGSHDLRLATGDKVEAEDARKWLAAAAKIITAVGGSDNITDEVLKCFIPASVVGVELSYSVKLQYIAIALQTQKEKLPVKSLDKGNVNTYSLKDARLLKLKNRRDKIENVLEKALKKCGVISEDTAPEKVSQNTLTQPSNVQNAIRDLKKSLRLLPSSLLDAFEMSMEMHLNAEEDTITDEIKLQLRKTLYTMQDAPIREYENAGSVPKDPIEAYGNAVVEIRKLKGVTSPKTPKMGNGLTELTEGIKKQEKEAVLAAEASKKMEKETAKNVAKMSVWIEEGLEWLGAGAKNVAKWFSSDEYDE